MDYNFDPERMELELRLKPKAGYWFKDYAKVGTANFPVNVYTNGTPAVINGFVDDCREDQEGWICVQAKVNGFSKLLVNFDANGGSGTMETLHTYSGFHELSVCTFTPPAEKQFKAWLVDGKELEPGSEYTVIHDMTVTAVWEDAVVDTGKWVQDENGYWYQNPDGTHPKDQWKKIDGNWYHFDKRGYRQTGWQKIDEKWYYFDENGVMQTGWYLEGSTYYYLKSNGVMASDEWVEDGKYYLNANGRWVKGKTKETGTWIKDENGWKYQNADGTNLTSSWKKINGKWYYFDEEGCMKVGWSKIGRDYYYFKADGSMAADEWIDEEKYYVDANGRWIKDAVKEE
ncbi:MAG: N-acetylmuramoyl-L-alanine amidase family protein [Lachnospiraceae bacterium]|nr:N-acetylmuramoyl-L-alanine amidase family protein [Lachnospiraceae bacterium]